MHVSNLYVRFYRSFNYDYLRRHHESASDNEWEMIDGVWCPFVSIPIGRYVTAIAGANEAGKSQFLNALEYALGTGRLLEGDFCRYSEYYSVGRGESRLPDVGVELAAISDEQRQTLTELFECQDVDVASGDARMVFYNGSDPVLSFDRGGSTQFALREAGSAGVSTFLPRCLRVSAQTPLPDSVPLAVLECDDREVERASQRHLSLSDRASVIDQYQNLQDAATDSAWVQDHTDDVLSFLRAVPRQHTLSSNVVLQFRLARALLLDIAGVDRHRFSRLREAARANDEGELRLIEEQINVRLNASLSLPQWWMQDQDFRLQVRMRGDSELSFTVSDRTAATYTFAERSSGLKYFLSYHLQFLLLKSRWSSERGSIILMDEPDSFLSSDGQRDLLRLMQDLVQPLTGLAPVQVVYVTHSPYMIDRNQADAVRLLSKGVGDEGVRVIGYAGQRLYEPIHSAIGAAAGDTARSGKVNLVVEGVADQSMLYGISRLLTRGNSQVEERLDMNTLAVVPADGASNVPFEVFALRSRAQDCPAVVVLLDTDEAGGRAKHEILSGKIGKRKLLAPELIISIGDMRDRSGLKLPKKKTTPLEIEDLIPEFIAVMVARRYLRMLCSASDQRIDTITADKLVAARDAETPLFKALQRLVAEASEGECRLEKRPFARLLVEVLDDETGLGDSKIGKDARELLYARFRALFSVLNQAIEVARDGDARSTMADQVSRRIRRFCTDHVTAASAVECRRILNQIEQLLVPGDEANAMRLRIAKLRDGFDLHHMASGNLSDFATFRSELASISTMPQQMAGLHLSDRGTTEVTGG